MGKMKPLIYHYQIQPQPGGVMRVALQIDGEDRAEAYFLDEQYSEAVELGAAWEKQTPISSEKESRRRGA